MEKMGYLKEKLKEHFGDDIEIISIKGVGWNPKNHIEADIVTKSVRIPLFLKALWPESQEAEMYAYSIILSQIDIRVPHLYGYFPDNELQRQWAILERAAGRWVKLSEEKDALSVFKLIGCLHGASKNVQPDCSVTKSLLFPSAKDRLEFSNRHHLLAKYAVELGLDSRITETFSQNFLNLQKSLMAWIHGDNDVSNMLINDEGLCLLDWERIAWAPPALDLGQIVNRLPKKEIIEKLLQKYISGYQSASGQVVTFDQAFEWVRNGMLFDDVRWVCYYLERINYINWDRQKWYDAHVLPRIKRLNSLIRDGIIT